MTSPLSVFAVEQKAEGIADDVLIASLIDQGVPAGTAASMVAGVTETAQALVAHYCKRLQRGQTIIAILLTVIICIYLFVHTFVLGVLGGGILVWGIEPVIHGRQGVKRFEGLLKRLQR